MAQMFPPKPPSEPWSEAQTYKALARLDDEWMVFHSVGWQSKRDGKEGDGEADFVIAHATKGIYVIEVKGGSSIDVIDGTWYTVSNAGGQQRIKNPFEQAVTSKHVLGRYLDERVSGLRKPSMGHAVVFPAFDHYGDFGPIAPADIVIDQASLSDIESAIDRLAKHWDGTTQFSESQLTSVRKALAPTIKIKRIVTNMLTDAERELIELTEQQGKLLSFLRQQRRVMVTGGAGTGKTVLACQKARELADNGFKVLLLCYNKPLGDKLQADFESEGVRAGNFHGFAAKAIAKAELTPADRDNDTWFDEGMAALLPDAIAQLDEKFDAIIVDEGQDFRPEWFAALEQCLAQPDDGFFYVFADENQSLYLKGWEAPFDVDPHALDINCRNTLPIASWVDQIYERKERSLGAKGLPPRFLPASSIDEQTHHVAASLDALLNKGGVGPRDVVVLCDTSKVRDALIGQTLAGWDLVGADSDDLEGVKVSTIHRFKGLESKAVILIMDNITDEKSKTLLYVGMSRAMAHLSVVAPEAFSDVISATD